MRFAQLSRLASLSRQSPVCPMIRFPRLTWRNALIALHDALATALALLLSFYLRFQDAEFDDRWPILLAILPYFIIFSVLVCYSFRLTTTKWRFISLPDLFNIVKVT